MSCSVTVCPSDSVTHSLRLAREQRDAYAQGRMRLLTFGYRSCFPSDPPGGSGLEFPVERIQSASMPWPLSQADSSVSPFGPVQPLSTDPAARFDAR